MQYQGSSTYPTYDLVMVGKVCLADLAAVDLLRVEVDVIGEALRHSVTSSSRSARCCMCDIPSCYTMGSQPSSLLSLSHSFGIPPQLSLVPSLQMKCTSRRSCSRYQALLDRLSVHQQVGVGAGLIEMLSVDGEQSAVESCS